MEALSEPSTPPFLEPEALADPSDPLNAEQEEEFQPDAPLSVPNLDPDTFEDEEAPETVAAMDAAADELEESSAGARPLDDSDDESELEELDETQFQDFDAEALKLPVAVDESNVGQLGVHKRKRTEGEERERKSRKRKEGRREKPGRERRREGGDDDGDDDFEGGVEVEGKRVRKSKVGADGRSVKASAEGRRKQVEAPPPEDEENLSPEERRRRALERKMDEALKSHRPTRRRGGIDLEAAADAEIDQMRQRMAKACEADALARSKGQVATHKLAILPSVIELLNRNTIQSQLVDPDINILEAVRFMLEPADHDAALPNYRIQRELFAVLGKLNLGKEALIASGIGKIVLFYTKSIQPQPDIKLIAEKLVSKWMRVVLGKNKAAKPNHNNSNPTTNGNYIDSHTNIPVSNQPTGQRPNASQAQILADRRKKLLAQPIPGNRARVEGGLATYTLAPVSQVGAGMGSSAIRSARSGEEAFRKIAQRGAGPGRK